jgi:hypothetical protein
MSEKPLNVRAAEALGWRADANGAYPPSVTCEMPCRQHQHYESLPDYDTDWAAIGPEVKRLGIHIIPEGRKWVALKELPHGAMVAFAHEPQEAAAKLIVDMKEAGVSLS